MIGFMLVIFFGVLFIGLFCMGLVMIAAIFNPKWRKVFQPQPRPVYIVHTPPPFTRTPPPLPKVA